MKTSIILALGVLVTVALGARPARADEPARAAVTPAPTEAPAPETPPRDPGVHPSTNGDPSTSPAFVDADGDGLQDGQEHRFRGRWKATGGQGGTGEGYMGRHGAGWTGERGGGRHRGMMP